MHASLVLSVVQVTCEDGHISGSKVALPCHGKQMEHKPVRGRLGDVWTNHSGWNLWVHL